MQTYMMELFCKANIYDGANICANIYDGANIYDRAFLQR